MLIARTVDNATDDTAAGDLANSTYVGATMNDNAPSARSSWLRAGARAIRAARVELFVRLTGPTGSVEALARTGWREPCSLLGTAP